MEDRLLLTTFQVTSILDDGSQGSLRWAIGQTNGGAGGDTIEFNINPGSGVQTIPITSALPAITVPVTIDATINPNYAGTPLVQIDGTGAGAGVNGLSITAGNTIVRGLSIVNFKGHGINISSGGGDVVQADYLGIRADGTTTAPNGGDGVLVTSSNNTIGGSLSGQGNLISGNSGYGIELNTGSSNLVAGNRVGVNANGTLKRGNTLGGILVKNSLTDTIGGTSSGAANIISGNASHGIETFGTTDGLVVQGNFIGTDVSKTIDLGNLGDGVHLFSSHNTIGGLSQGAGNVIAFNGNSTSGNVAGIAMVLNVANNTIYSNSIFSNVGLGISLGGSGNQNQQYPTLTAASTDGTNTVITGSLNLSVPSSTYNVQFFSNAAADPSGFGEGQTLLGTAQVTTDGNGNATFTRSLPVSIVPGSFLSATATAPNGNTSQFSQVITAQGTADVGVAVQSAPTSVNAGAQVTYTLTATNNGSTLARGVSVVNLIPSGATLVSANSAQATVVIGASSVTFNFGTLGVGQTGEATVVVQTSTSSIPSITDSATISSQEGDPQANNNSASVTTPVNPVTDLSVTVQGSPSSVPAGQNVTYTVTLSNNGPSPATNVSLTDTLPQNVTLVSANSTQGSTSLSGNVLTTTIPTLPANGTPVVLTVVVATNAATAASITDLASVSATESDANPGNNSGSATTAVTPVVDMGVVVQASPNPVQVGQNLTYTVTATNHGPSTATNVKIIDALPANVTFVSAIDSVGGTPTSAAGTVTDTIPSLIANGVVTLTIVVATNGATAASISDSASVSATEPDPNTTNDTASVTTATTPVTDLSVTMVASPNGVGAGQSVTYTITAKNNGPSQATGVTLMDLLPSGVTVVSVTPSQGTTSQGAGSVIANVGTLGPNVSATLTIVVTTSASNPPSIVNSVSASGNEFDPNSSNNSVSTTTPVTPVTDLSVSLSPSAEPVQVNQTLSYAVIVTNNGPSPATGVVLTITLPAGLSFFSGSDSLGHAPTAQNGTITDPIGALASGGTVTATIVVTPTSAGQVLTSAAVTGNETDNNTTNNTSLASTTVLAVANLSVALAADQAAVTTGSLLTYTATVTNNGPSDATGATLTETLPGGVTVVSVTPSQGTAANDNGVVTASLGALPQGSTATLTIVVIPTSPGASTASASVTATEVDPNGSDNSASATVQFLEPPGTLQFATSSVTVNENAGHATILVTRTNGSQGSVTVKFFTVLTGSATPGVDFKPVSGTLTFPDGVTSQSITVPVLANPHDNHDETVHLVLRSPQTGAELGSQSSTTLVIHDIDPDLIAPRVLDTRLFGTATSITDIILSFSEGLSATSARSLSSYQLIDAGSDGRIGTGDDRPVALRAPLYSPANSTVTLQPVAGLRPNEFYFVRLNGVTDQAGNALSAGAGSLPGSSFGTYLARGTSLQFTDSHGSAVSLRLSGAGLMDLTRYPNGDAQRLQVLNAIPRRTTITGRVRGGSNSTTFDSITGLGFFGQVRLNMTTPPFYVTHMPFDRTILSPPAVDGVFSAGGVSGRSKALSARRLP